MHIITHRGLDPSIKNFFAESSLEAFADQLMRGFGLEFDLQSTKDGQIVILHDKDLRRISRGVDTRKVDELTTSEISSLVFNGYHIASLPELLKLINEKGDKEAVHAIHVKRGFQTKKLMDTLLENLRDIDHKNFIIFDVTLETARYLKEKNDKLNLAPSIAHPFDIERYNQAVGGTLLSVEEALANHELFSWVWLDEWDRTDKNNDNKKLYTREIFQLFHILGIKITVVSPELHATSPSLQGGETHPDALDMHALEKRLNEIVALKPDAICTDYPDKLKTYSL